MGKEFHKIAAVDAGTNSFHLIVVSADSDGNFEIIDREREVIRLNEGNPDDIKIINAGAIEKAVAVLKSFKGIADSHGAPLRVVATSALRESLNRNEFINKVWNEAGVEIEVISGHEEARLIYLGIMQSVPIFKDRTLIVDIGGGSTEFLVGEKGKTLFSASVKLGAVRMMQKFFKDNQLSKESTDECRKWIRGELYNISETAKSIGYDYCVGSSGTIMAAGMMVESLVKKRKTQNVILNNYQFDSKSFGIVRDEVLKRKTEDKRKSIPGLDDKRADIIPAGILILDEIFKLFGLQKMTISSYALREGIIIDILNKEFKISHGTAFHDIRKKSVNKLAGSFEYDHSHCKFVASLAVALFDQLKPLHLLEDRYREYLEDAALLHDIGYQISHTNHHQHSYYIIRNSELPGFNETEIVTIAHIARYHRKSHPKLSHNDFSSLPEKTQIIIRKLAAILRIADSLDRTHSKKIRNIRSKISENEVRLSFDVAAKENADIELWDLSRRKGLFEEVYQKKIKVELK